MIALAIPLFLGILFYLASIAGLVIIFWLGFRIASALESVADSLKTIAAQKKND
ncbi:hypothetical protein ACFLS9_00370 [Bacteroidota bacterium]